MWALLKKIDLSTASIKQLRTAAVRAVGCGRAGANPTIRLSLLTGNALSDPGFFQLWHVVRTFKRVLVKQASLIDLWTQFIASYNARTFAGPFSVLMRQLNLVLWAIEAPPFLVDHEGHLHNLLIIDNGMLHDLLEDAWLQKTAREVSTRADFQGLEGINWAAVKQCSSHLTALENARVNTLREGAFYLNTQKAKFDNLSTSQCNHCPANDTAEHRCLECPAFAECHAQHEQARRLWHDSPVCVRERLLLPRNPLLGQVREYFYNLKNEQFRLLFRACASLFNLGIGEVRSLNLSSLGVGPPQSGLTLELPRCTLHNVDRALRTFCAGRPIRTANDLARPFK